MITPAIPMWLPEKLWQGLQFEDMVEVQENGYLLFLKKKNQMLW